MSADMSWRGGDEVTYIVLIVLAHSSRIGELCELQVKHRTTRGNTEGQPPRTRLVRALVLSQISHIPSTEKGEPKCSPLPDELFALCCAGLGLALDQRCFPH